MISIKRTNSKNQDFKKLVRLLDSDLAGRDGEDHPLAQFNTIDDIKRVVLAYEHNEPMGCGAMSQYAPTTTEIKRMYVRPEVRGKRVAARILSELEHWAQEMGHSKCILFMGVNQPEARRLYERNGYIPIKNYGTLADIPDSLCYAKDMTDHIEKREENE